MGLAIVLLFLVDAAQKYPSADGRLPFLARLDNILYDTRLNLAMPRGVDPSIVILDIDEKSLGEVGHWPWSRALMAELITKLFERYGIEVLAFDVVWAERDTSSGIDTLDALAHKDLKQAAGFQELYKSLRPGLDNDELFAKAMRGRPAVLGYYFSNEERAARVNAIPVPVLPQGSFAGRNTHITSWSGYTGNLAAYQNNAAAAGHFNPVVDDDGVTRRVPLLAEFEGAYYEALSLAVVRTFIARQEGRFPAVEPGYPQAGARADAAPEWLKVGPLRIPVDDQAAVLIPYRGKRHSFRYIPLADVVKDKIKDRFGEMRRMGIKTVMITGDNPVTAAAIAAEAGVDDFLAEATPENKLAMIRDYQAKGHLVAMTGDGTNDAPALAQADVAVAMNSGTQAAKEAGNMVDLDSNPTKLLEVVTVGKQMLMTRGALTTFSIANDVSKYFAIIPAAFVGTYPQLEALNVMRLHSPASAVLSAVIFNALIIIALIPLALRGLTVRAAPAAVTLRRNILVYGVGGLILPFPFIKLIDVILAGLGLVS